MPLTNRQVRLAARPSGLPRSTDWSLTAEEVPEPAEGQFVVAVSHLSVDPAMRGWMNAGASYVPPVEIGAVMRAGAVGRVTASAHPGFAAGDDVYGTFGVQEYAVSDGRGVTKIDTSLAGPSTYLGALGATGPTAYFDNVGGEILDDVLTRLALGARVIICGAVSQYNETQVRGPANYLMLLVARASMTGMLVFDYVDRYPQALAELAGWLREGKIVSREHVVHGGVDAFPETLLMLFDGVNTGKLVLALDRG